MSPSNEKLKFTTDVPFEYVWRIFEEEDLLQGSCVGGPSNWKTLYASPERERGLTGNK